MMESKTPKKQGWKVVLKRILFSFFGLLLIVSLVRYQKAASNLRKLGDRYEDVSNFSHRFNFGGNSYYEHHIYQLDSKGRKVCAACGHIYDPESTDYAEYEFYAYDRHTEIDYDADGNELCRFYDDHHFDDNGQCACGAKGTPSANVSDETGDASADVSND